jgi:hypothetical protein
MGEILEVKCPNGGAASSLARSLTEDLGLSATALAVRDFCVEVETQSHSLPGLLSAVEEWGQRNTVSSLCVRLNGRAYVLECPKTANALRRAT